MDINDLREGADMLYFNATKSLDILCWHVEQLIEDADNEPTIKPVNLRGNIYLMKPDEKERDVSAELGDSYAKMIAVMEAYCAFLQDKGMNISFTNENMDFLKNRFIQDYKNKDFIDDFIHSPEVLENFKTQLARYRNIFDLVGFLKDL